MGIDARIKNHSTNETACVSQKSLHVVQHPAPPNNLGGVLEIIPFSQTFQTAAGSSDMAVDGTTPVEFTIGANLNASQNRDRYLTAISVLLSDAGMEAGLFGALATLGNGLDFEFFSPAIGTIAIDGKITRNIDFVRLGLGTPSFAGTSNTAYIVGLVSAAPAKDEAYIPVIDLRETFGLQPGLRLPSGSEAKLIFRVNDDLTELTEFNITAYGFEHILDT